MDVSYRQLKAFIALIETKSFTLAANRNCVTQSALSQALKKLEEQFGVALIEKHGRSFIATKSGIHLYEDALYITHRLERIKQDYQAGMYPSLRVSAIYTMASSLIPKALQALLINLPNLQFKLYEYRIDDIEKAVKNGSTDIGISTRPHDRELIFEPLFADYLCFVCHQSHKLAQAASVSIKDIADDVNIGVSPNNSLRHLADLAFEKYGLQHDPEMNISHTATIIGMVENKIGTAILSSTIGYIDQSSRICFIPITPKIYREIGVLTHPENRNTVTREFTRNLYEKLNSWSPILEGFAFLKGTYSRS